MGYFTVHHGNTASTKGKKLFYDTPQLNQFEDTKEDEHSLQLTAVDFFTLLKLHTVLT